MNLFHEDINFNLILMHSKDGILVPGEIYNKLLDQRNVGGGPKHSSENSTPNGSYKRNRSESELPEINSTDNKPKKSLSSNFDDDDVCLNEFICLKLTEYTFHIV